jgi:hypothetical protein
MAIVLRPLSTSELLDRAFFLYRKDFLVFAGITALAELPAFALRLGNAALIGARVRVAYPVIVLILLVANFIAIGVAHAATVIAVSDLHLERPAGIRSAYAAAKSKILRVIWISLVVTVLIPLVVGGVLGGLVAMVLAPMGLGNVGGTPIASLVFILIVVGFGFYWWLARSVVIPVTVLEGTDLGESMERSRTLTENTRGRIFVICLLVLALTWAIRGMFQVPLWAAGGLHYARGALRANAWPAAFFATGAFVGASLAGPLLTIALTLVYYDARVRKEGFDLEVMLSALTPIAESGAGPDGLEIQKNIDF